MIRLTILSWNVLFSNTKFEEILAYIRTVDADLVCLQEVSGELLEQLHTLPYYLAEGTDVIFVSDAWHPEYGETQTHVVVLSKFPILRSQTHALPPLPRETHRTRFFDNLQYIAGTWKGGAIRDKQTVSADLEIEGRAVRVFSTHLALLTPQIRLAEFAVVKENLLPNAINIVAGDFNILESPYIKVFNWMRGGRFRDAMPWANERNCIEKEFAAVHLKNPLRGMVTHPISDSQLDHILVPSDAKVLDRNVSKYKHGSDHAPVQVSIRI